MTLSFNNVEEVDKGWGFYFVCVFTTAGIFFNYNVLIFPLAHFRRYNACSSACIK